MNGMKGWKYEKGKYTQLRERGPIGTYEESFETNGVIGNEVIGPSSVGCISAEKGMPGKVVVMP